MNTERNEKRRKALQELLERLKEGQQTRAEPTDAQIIQAITGRECPLTAEETQEDHASISSDDYDQWIMDALLDRQAGRIRRSLDRMQVEHPTARVFRLGIESIQTGKTSEVFISLLEQMAERAERHDALSEIFPEDFPTKILQKQMKAANQELLLAKIYRAFASKHKKLPFKAMKEGYRILLEKRRRQIHPKMIDRALKAYGLDWSAKPGPKQTPKSRVESWDNYHDIK